MSQTALKMSDEAPIYVLYSHCAYMEMCPKRHVKAQVIMFSYQAMHTDLLFETYTDVPAMENYLMLMLLGAN